MVPGVAAVTGKNAIDPRTPRLLQVLEQTPPAYALGRNDENPIYPWEICEVSSGSVLIRAASEDVARTYLAMLNDGAVEIDL